MITNRKKYGLILFAILCSFLLVVSGITVHPVNAAERTKNAISVYLNEKNVNYCEVSVNNQILSIKIKSDGEDRCTIEDVVALQTIYEAVHGKVFLEKITDMYVEIINENGDVLFDEYTKDVSSMISDIELLVDVKEKEYTDKEIFCEVQRIVEDTTFSIKRMEIKPSDVLCSKKLELVLTEDEEGATSLSDVRSIYENLEAYSLSTRALSQCEITLVTDKDECLVYMGGDFMYGDCTAWLSEKIENSSNNSY